MMKILQLTSHLDIGGIPRYVVLLSERLVRRSHRVIIASDTGVLTSALETERIPHWALPLHTSAEFSPRVLTASRELANRLIAEPVDVIHAHTRVAQVVADRVARRLRIPYVTTWHGIYKRRVSRRLWPCTGALTIAISQPVYQDLLQSFHVPAASIRKIYNGVDAAHFLAQPDRAALDAFRAECQLPPGVPVIGSVGRLAAGRVKGFDLILVAAYLLKEALPSLHVLIVGDGPRRPFLEDVARRLGLQDQVCFAGSTKDTRVALALMDVFVFSSRWPEAFGLTLVEAMAAGKAIVAVRSGAVPDIITHGEHGWLVPPEDPAAMAEAVQQLLADPMLAQQLGRQAQARVSREFTLDRMVGEIEAVYREVVDAHGRTTECARGSS